jgi:transposase-like protein
LAVEGEHRPEPRPRRKPSKPRRSYALGEMATALELVAGGRTLREAADAVGATHPTVLRWLRNAA